MMTTNGMFCTNRTLFCYTCAKVPRVKISTRCHNYGFLNKKFSAEKELQLGNFAPYGKSFPYGGFTVYMYVIVRIAMG